MTAAYGEFTQRIVRRVTEGRRRADPTRPATTVRVREGRSDTAGPFAENKDLWRLHYLIDAKDMDEATRGAARFRPRSPAAEVGPVGRCGAAKA